MILGGIAGEDLLVLLMRADRRVVRVVIVVRVMRVTCMVLVSEHHSCCLQIDMPGRRAPGADEEDGEECAETRHRLRRSRELFGRCKAAF